LPESEQDKYAAQFLKELLENETDTGRQWIGGRKPTKEEIASAIEGLRQFQKGKILGPDLTIR
jgi:hypothetical protein